MKKIYSTIMMLAMMVATLCLTNCGGDDDDENGGGSFKSSTFTITYDGVDKEVENVNWLNPLYGNARLKKGNYFCFENYPLGRGQIHIIFPFNQYGENVPPSFFRGRIQ